MTELSHAPFLLVEDNERDIDLMRRAFRKLELTNPLYVTRDGEQAVEYLTGQGIYGNREEFPLPFLILLDLQLPKRNGLEVLQWLRSTASLKHILVVVLSASEDGADIRKAYDAGANSYLIKRGNNVHVEEMMEMMEKHWAMLNTIVEFRQHSSQAA